MIKYDSNNLREKGLEKLTYKPILIKAKNEEEITKLLKRQSNLNIKHFLRAGDFCINEHLLDWLADYRITIETEDNINYKVNIKILKYIKDNKYAKNMVHRYIIIPLELGEYDIVEKEYNIKFDYVTDKNKNKQLYFNVRELFMDCFK